MLSLPLGLGVLCLGCLGLGRIVPETVAIVFSLSLAIRQVKRVKYVFDAAWGYASEG